MLEIQDSEKTGQERKPERLYMEKKLVLLQHTLKETVSITN